MADLNKLSGAELGSTNHGSEYILRGKIEDGGRKLPLQKMLSSPYEEDDCSQLFLQIIIVQLHFHKLFYKEISKQSNSESSPGTCMRSCSAAMPATTKNRNMCGSFYFLTNYRPQNIGSVPTKIQLVCSGHNFHFS